MSFENGHALVIGTGVYSQMSQYNVPIAARDAQALADVLIDMERCAYPQEQVTFLANEQATRTAILAALEESAGKLDDKASFLMFYAGHGVYGTDGNYYLTTHDTRLEKRQVVPGTGISELELLECLRKLPVKRMLIVINACHAGELDLSFAVEKEGDSIGSEPPPQKLTEALLSTGEGRITICACRSDQKSYIGTGKLSIFSQALVNGLRGEAPNSHGYISAFGLYEYLYDEVSEAARGLGLEQEPELTVIQGIGPFPVALYRAAAKPGDFDFGEQAPTGKASRVVSAEKSRRSYARYEASLNGNGAIAQGAGAQAVGGGNVVNVGRDFSGNIVIGVENQASNETRPRKRRKS